MGCSRKFLPQFDYLHKCLLNRIFHVNMVGIVSSLWECFCGYVLCVFGSITRYFLRLLKSDRKNYNYDRIEFYGENKREEEKEKESKVVDNSDTSCSTITNKYEVFILKDINGYAEEPKAMSFTVQELYLGSKVSSEEDYKDSDKAEGFEEQELHVSSSPESEETSSVGEVSGAREVDDYWKEFKFEFLPENDIKGLSLVAHEEDLILESKKEELFEVKSQSENHSLPCDDKSVTINEDEDILDSAITYEFEVLDCEKIVGSATQFVDNDSEEEEFIELEPGTNIPGSGSSSIEFGRKEVEEREEKLGNEWEHEDVIEQLKWELRNARGAGRLPTILEEESEDEADHYHHGHGHDDDDVRSLRGVKIDEVKYGYKEKIEEVQKVYNVYAERMRKLDILNNQTMHAHSLGFLQLKNQLKPTTKRHKSIVNNLLPINKTTKIQSDTSESALKYDAKLQNDFELVYVGQVCLSWEILLWQHRRVRDLLINDNSQSCRRFNLVASEFQLFQVLLQRFVEDESFRGPRVHNYVKNRCVIRSLMQVPVVKDDHLKNKQYVMEQNEYWVCVESLDKVIVEAILTFGEFVRKDENINLKVSRRSVSESGDSKLFMEVRREFHKKERKLKDLQKIGNCVVRKLQKNQQHGRTFQHALLLAQVELRLVSRVLSMSRLSRDQLVWCQQKLNLISFANKMVRLEISFLLFPC